MTTIETAQKTAADLVTLLATAKKDTDAIQRASIQFRAERDAAGTKIADLERINAALSKTADVQIENLKAAHAEITRLNAIISPPAPPPVAVVKTHIDSDPRPTVDKRNLPGTPGHPSPGELANDPRYSGKPAGNPVPPDSDNDHTHQRAVAAAEREQDRKDQKAEDAREDRAAVKASLQPPARHK